MAINAFKGPSINGVIVEGEWGRPLLLPIPTRLGFRKRDVTLVTEESVRGKKGQKN
jgi:hypothetical protein